MAHGLRKAGLAVEQQRGLTITYDGIVAGRYGAGLIGEQALLVELKAVNAPNEAHHAQCIHYLRSSGLILGLLLNFGMKRVGSKRLANAV